jgi:hypothetical protein
MDRKIAETALEFAQGQPLRIGSGATRVDLHVTPGYCLAFARRVVEVARGWPDHGFYERYGKARVERAPGPAGGPWWARDLERSLRDVAKLAVPTGAELEPGDLLFNWRAAVNRFGVYVGHVGVLTFGGLVAEQVAPAYRRHSLRREDSPILLTPLERYVTTTAIRLPRE